jgi:hypothetical protein
VSDEAEDPGWSSLPQLFALVLPGVAIRRQRTGTDLLVGLRQIFVTFVWAIVLIGVVSFIVTPDMEPSLTSGVAALGVLLVGGVAYGLPRVIAKPLVCESPTTLAESYRVGFFLRVGCADSAAMFGFVASILSATPWVYVVGAAITAVGFAELAPTAAHLERDQDELRDRGCNLSLIAALRGTGPQSP